MSTDQGSVAVLCGWEGNRRSGVTQDFVVYLPKSSMASKREMSNLPMLHNEYNTLYFVLNKLEMHGKAYRVSRPAQRVLRSARFTKFLSDVEGLSAGFTRASALRSSRPLCNANAQNEGGVCQFSPIRGKNRLP